LSQLSEDSISRNISVQARTLI